MSDEPMPQVEAELRMRVEFLEKVVDFLARAHQARDWLEQHARMMEQGEGCPKCMRSLAAMINGQSVADSLALACSKVQESRDTIAHARDIARSEGWRL